MELLARRESLKGLALMRTPGGLGEGRAGEGVPRRSILGDLSAFCNVFIAQAAHLKIITSHSEHCLGLFSSTAAMFEKTRTAAANSGASQHAIPWKSILC